MANKEELKTMIRCFRVHELHLLLSFAGRSKNGKKQELQDRALSLLKLQSEPLAIKIRHLYNSMQNNAAQHTSSEVNISASSTTNRHYKNSEPSDKDDDSIAIIDDVEYNEKCMCNERGQCHNCTNTHKSKGRSEKQTAHTNSLLDLALNPLYYPDHPDVKLKKLPFYKVLNELLRPSCLVPKKYRIQQKNSFLFYLTPQQAAAICVTKDAKQEMQNESPIQGQLRFSLLETTSRQDDSFPDGLIVRVNNEYCNIQDAPKKKRKDMLLKEPSPPINITSLMKTDSNEANKIDVQWNSNYGLVYILAVYLVQKKTAEDLLNSLKTKSVRSSDYTKRMIEEKLKDDADSEIVTTSLRVSLICPLGKIRLQSPCRASTCQHLQCFDASLYLQMNEKKPTWICPVCDNPAEYDKLFIDRYFKDILSSENLPMDVNEIEVHSDGSWSCVRIKVEENFTSSESILVKMEQDDDIIDVLHDSMPTVHECLIEHSTYNTSGNPTVATILEKRKVDEIDLTLSDSDDEPLIYYKRRGSSKNTNNTETLAISNSNPSSPSVIHLDDSESSDSHALMSNSITDSNDSATGVADYSTRTDLSKNSSKTSDSIIPWFPESTVFF